MIFFFFFTLKCLTSYLSLQIFYLYIYVITFTGMYDTCHPSQANGWRIGMSSQHLGDIAIFASLHPDRSAFTTKLLPHQTSIPLKWTHIAVTFDSYLVSLYINGVLVMAKHINKGPLFSDITRNCKVIYLGGNPKDDLFFRGRISNVQLWPEALNHSGVHSLASVQAWLQQPSNGLLPNGNLADISLWKQDDVTLDLNWHAHIINPSRSTLPEIPTCGETICDNPYIITQYAEDWVLRQPKTVNYRVVNIAEDDGTNPVVTQDQMEAQDAAIHHAFKPYNISWNLEIVNVNNSNIRRKIILVGCALLAIGNGQCDPECQHPVTGNDGGDCSFDLPECYWEFIGDGQCDIQCNNQYNRWDGGDCCSGQHVNGSTTCIDPHSDNR